MFTMVGMSVVTFGAGPALRLLVELELEVVDPDGAQVRARRSRRTRGACDGPLPVQQVHLVVAVEVVLVGPVAELHALEQLVGDVRIAGGGDQGGEPVEAGEDAVLDRARLDLARPAGDARHAEAAFHDACPWCP